MHVLMMVSGDTFIFLPHQSQSFDIFFAKRAFQTGHSHPSLFIMFSLIYTPCFVFPYKCTVVLHVLMMVSVVTFVWFTHQSQRIIYSLQKGHSKLSKTTPVCLRVCLRVAGMYGWWLRNISSSNLLANPKALIYSLQKGNLKLAMDTPVCLSTIAIDLHTGWGIPLPVCRHPACTYNGRWLPWSWRLV